MKAARPVARDLGDGALLLFHLTADGRLAAASGVGPLGKIGREVRLAEMLIAKRARPDRDGSGFARRQAEIAAGRVRLKAIPRDCLADLRSITLIAGVECWRCAPRDRPVRN